MFCAEIQLHIAAISCDSMLTFILYWYIQILLLTQSLHRQTQNDDPSSSCREHTLPLILHPSAFWQVADVISPNL